MKFFQHKSISLLALLSILTVVLGPLWIGHAEAKLGIEICTAQGVKTIPAPDGMDLDGSSNKQSSDHDALSSCLICAQSDQDGICPNNQIDISLPVSGGKLSVSPYTENQRHNTDVHSPISPRAPPRPLL